MRFGGIGSAPGHPTNSVVRISEKARPIQSVAPSGPRFSNRKMAMRSTRGRAGCRVQLAATRHASKAEMRRRLQYTRFQRQQLLEFGQLLHAGKLRLLTKLLFAVPLLQQIGRA